MTLRLLLGTRGWDLEAWRYRLAALLDKLPGTCWTDLVLWVEYGQEPLRDVLERGNTRCHDEAANLGRCYCGKVRTPAEIGRDRVALLPRPVQPCSRCGSSFCSAGEDCDDVPF